LSSENFLKNLIFIFLSKAFEGVLKLRPCLKGKKNLLNKALERLLRKKTVFEITDAEILGQYEMITEYVSPLWQEK
jgi:hypothetical protein